MTVPFNILKRVVENIVLHLEANNFIKTKLITDLNVFTNESHKHIETLNLKITKLEIDVQKLQNDMKKVW